MLKHLKHLRVAISIVIFILVSFYFIDDYQVLPEGLISWIPDVQLIPALMVAFKGGVAAIAIVAAIALITFLFGRVYCSTICPLGFYQDIIIRIKKWTNKKFRFKFKRSHFAIHYSITAIALVLLIAGVTAVIVLLDPYSNFGRMAGDTFKPPFLKGMSFIAHRMQRANIFWLSPINYKVVWYGIIYGSAFTLIITALSWWRGRFFCNVLCPAGGLLSILARKSVYKLSIENSSCTSCGDCMHSCKAECISVKDKTIDASRCISCYNCIDSCSSQSISFNVQKTSIPKENTTTAEASGNRRKIISESLGIALSVFALPALAQKRNGQGPYGEGRGDGEGRGQGDGNGHGNGKGHYRNKGIVTPPGSYSLAHFNANCTACHLCVAKCPSNVLQPTFTEYGLSYMLQPKMHYDTSYCGFNCTVCGEVCPTGAIKPITREEKHVCQIGQVHFAKRHCVVETEGTSCGSCSEHCPTQAVYMVPYGDNLTIPEVNPELCVGCGACEHACPVLVPHKAIFVKANEVHQVADKPKEEAIDFDVTEDFPF